MSGIATASELAFVAMLLLIVLVAPKVPRIGEAIGRRLGAAKSTPGASPADPARAGRTEGAPADRTK